MSFKGKHLEEDIKRQLIYIIRNLKNSSLESKQIGVSRVIINNKGFKARIYVSSLKGFLYAKQAIKHIEKASGFIKQEISKNLRLKKAPQIEFIADDYLEYSAHLEELFLKIRLKN